jgi:tetratricopeptide (TPR) repeat protein
LNALQSSYGLFRKFRAPLLLAALTFLAYQPSLKSDFVYDARDEILAEGFITSPANLSAVLSFKVLGTHLLLGDRPGHLLYLMLNAAVWGKEPWGYHLSSNLLHAANAALLFVFAHRLLAAEPDEDPGAIPVKIEVALATAILIFALHPLAVEAVSGISYSSDLLVMFFTLLGLLAATAFRPDHLRTAVPAGCLGVVCAFAAVTCKESGIAAAFLPAVYWFLFRRRETKGPWFLFLGGAMAVTAAFLAARFYFAPSDQDHLHYLGGSFPQVFLIQPRFWVFMMGKLVWPVNLSADYTLENVGGISLPLALLILATVVSLQVWLAAKSRLGAMGVAFYWLGLATVSNFLPLHRILADRFYYLPLAGAVMQLLAVVLMAARSRLGFWMAVTPLLIALLPLTLLTLKREAVFGNELALWTDTIEASPFSATAHTGLGDALLDEGRVEQAIAQYRKALGIDPNFANAHFNFGNALVQQGGMDRAMAEYQKTVAIKPDFFQAHYNLGNRLFQMGRVDEAIAQYQATLKIDPSFALAHTNLGIAFSQKGEMEKAVAEFEEVVRLNPHDGDAQNNLARAREIARQSAATK